MAGTMSMAVFESYWANKAACDDAERAYYEKLSKCKVTIYSKIFQNGPFFLARWHYVSCNIVV